MKVLEICKADRPREKLMERGAQALGTGELLAIMLRTGRKGESAIELAQRLLSSHGGTLTALADCSPEVLASVPGMGPGKAATVLAAFEIGRRFMQEEVLGGPGGRACISSPDEVHRLMQPRLRGLRHEECWEILLDARSRLIKYVKVTVGSSRSTIIDTQALVRHALENGAGSVILVHNHPGGSARPSVQDIRETKALTAALAACSIRLLDHVIIADEHYYSFNDEKMY